MVRVVGGSDESDEETKDKPAAQLEGSAGLCNGKRWSGKVRFVYLLLSGPFHIYEPVNKDTIIQFCFFGPF